MYFFTGLHMPNHAKYFERAFISVNRLEKRKKNFEVKKWVLDSGAFSRITTQKGHMEIKAYAEQIKRWMKCGTLLAAVCQDYMCEEFILKITGLCVGDHQAMTIDNYQSLLGCDCGKAYIMPVLQGYEPEEYIEHIKAYNKLLKHGAWCGVGSVCKRNSNVASVETVLSAIKKERPDLKLHGFGLKQTALRSGYVRKLLYSADSMAWSFNGRKTGDQNNVKAAIKFSEKIETQNYQLSLPV